MSIGDGVSSTNQRRHDAVERGVAVGFFTDPTLCIGCKACEVACKEWNQLPDDIGEWSGHSYDHTMSLGASTWRHVKFVEQNTAKSRQLTGGEGETPFRWLFLSDVCKHCEEAGCLESCPTGAIIRVENDSVFVQNDVCNGCGYCVVSCPFGVIDKRPKASDDGGGAFKCTFCYDRQEDGLPPACAKACPTESIQFGPLDDVRERAAERVKNLHALGYDDASIYDPRETSVRGVHALFLILGDPEIYGLPPVPEAPTIHLRAAWAAALATSAVMVIGVILLFILVSP